MTRHTQTTKKTAKKKWDQIRLGKRCKQPVTAQNQSAQPWSARTSPPIYIHKYIIVCKPANFELSGEIQEGDSEALVEDFEKYALNYDYNDLVSIDDGAEEPGTYEQGDPDRPFEFV